ncbi:MAG TPA: iron-sulfur cluster assembly protein, partial [Actinomycetota bacterium]
MQGLDSVDETSADIDSGPIPVDGTSGTAHPGQAGGAPDGETLKEQVLEVLKEVHDPELGVNIVDLG